MFEDLKVIVIAVLRDALTEKQIASLAYYCHTIAKSLISNFHSKHVRNFIHLEYDLDSFAWRCIEDFFLTRKNIRCNELKQYLSIKFPDIEIISPQEISIAIRNLISNKISQTIPEIYGESDQTFRKILRNVTRYLKNGNDYQIKQFVFGTLVYRSSTDPLLHHPEFPDEELRARFAEYARFEMQTTSLIDALFTMLDGQTKYRRALTLLTIITLIRDYFYQTEQPENEQVENFTTEMERGEVIRIIDRTSEFMSNGILQKYVERGTLKQSDLLCMKNAITSYLTDLSDGGFKPLAEYHKEQFPRVTYKQYRCNHRSKFEYVMSIAKERFGNECEKYFGWARKI